MLRSLQAGRAIAAISVAAFHLSLTMGLPRYGGHAVFRQYTQFGDRGVDFFFVLSGFIILLAHQQDIGQPRATGRYLYKRFIRVFPVYWIYTLGFACALLLFGGTDATMPSGGLDWLSTLSLIRFTEAAPPLAVAWTLFHEVAFYAVFALLIVNRRAGLVTISVFVAIALAFYQYPTEQTRTAFNVYTSGYNIFFVLGMGACLLHRRGGDGVTETCAGALSTVCAFATAPLPWDASPLLVAFSLALLLIGVTKLERAGRLAVPGAFVFLGDASYSIYLTHLAFEGVLLKVAMKAQLPSALGYPATYLLVLGGTVILGCVAYSKVEVRLLAVLRPRATRPSLRRDDSKDVT